MLPNVGHIVSKRLKQFNIWQMWSSVTLSNVEFNGVKRYQMLSNVLRQTLRTWVTRFSNNYQIVDECLAKSWQRSCCINTLFETKEMISWPCEVRRSRPLPGSSCALLRPNQKVPKDRKPRSVNSSYHFLAEKKGFRGSQNIRIWDTAWLQDIDDTERSTYENHFDMSQLIAEIL